MKYFSIFLIIFFFGNQFSANGQCNITPELESDAIEDPPGNSPDYIVVCTAGASTGALLVQNGISSNFFNAFNSYTINWGDGSANFTTNQDIFTDPAATHEYAVGNYILTFSATASNCTVTNQYNVYVGNTPSVSVGSPGGTQGCSEVTISFPISNASNNIPTTEYSVTYSDGSATEEYSQPPPASVTHTFNDSSCGETFQGLSNSYGVTMVATNECGTAQVTVAPVTISDPPDANFTSSVQTACTGTTINFDDTSYAGTTATSNSCTSNARFYWTISPSSGWTLASGALGSNNGLPNNFNVWTTGTDLLGVNFTTAGTYTVNLIYRNGCGPSTHTETICIINPPTCDFDVNNNSGCGPLSVSTDNNTIAPQCGNNNINVNYNWSVVVPTGGSYTVTSGSLTSNSPNFNFTNTTTAPLTYTINLSATPINPQTGAAMTDCSSNCSETITVYPAPVISNHPTPNQTICVGGTPNSISVSYLYGVGTPSYQWYSNTTNSNTGGTLISGATSASYAPPTLNTAGNYYYYVVISLGGTCGTIVSNPAQVTVVPDPTISTQPITPQTICSGGTPSAIQMAYANGTGTPSYQWFSNTTSSTTGGTPIPGATSASYTPSVPTTPGTYYFYGTVSTSGSGCNVATTNSSSVIVISDPTISLSPTEITLCQNAPSQSITTNVTGGNGTNSYQWFQSATTSNSNGTLIPNQTGASFTPSTATVGTQYYYVQLTQSTSGCSAVSQVVTVNILPAASINVQPIPSTVCVGGVPNTLTATYINGLGTPTYQWYSSTNAAGNNPVVINGATSANYIPPTDIVGVIYYFVSISFPSGGCSNISSTPVPVTVIADPTISIQPTSNQEICVGGSLPNSFTSTTTGGTGNLTYQWYSNTTSSNANGQIISGATSPTYLPPAFSTSGTVYYYATISASGIGCNTSLSNVVSVNVLNDPLVSSQPLSTQTVCQNTPTETLSATITGGIGNVTYTWFSNSSNSTTGGTQVSTSPTFTPPSSSVGTIYYYAIVNQSGAGCSVTTAIAAVTVTPTPTITAQPQPSTVCVGGTPTTLSVSYINGLGTPSYQWYTSSNSNGSNSTAISGAVNDTYSPPSSTAGQLYYFVIVSFPNGSCSNITSNTALVNILPDPFISTQPNSPLTICQGNSAATAFSITAQGGTSPLSYQWYTNSAANTSGGTLIIGANQNTYNPGVINTPGNYYYYITASSSGNGCETTTSNLVTLTVNPAATASVLGPFTTCGTSEIPINSTSSGAGTWSAPAGSGTFANANNNATTYTPNSSSAQNITLTWTTSDPDGTGPCPAVSANGTLTIFPPATASVSPLTSLCSNATLSLVATSNSPGQWSTNGNGTFSSSTNLTSVYTPGVSDINNSPLNFTWTTQDPDGSGPCVSVSATQSVTIYSPPTVNAGQDQILCLNSSQVTLSATPIGGAWAGNGIGTNGTFNPTTLGNFNLVYTFTDSNGCTSNDDINITVNQSAIADANGPYATCGVSPIAISATTNGNGTWTGGAGTFANASNASTTYTPTAAEVGTEITLTWETFDPDGSGPCSNAIDNTTLNISTPATATPGGPYTICSSDVANIQVTTTPGAGTWTGGAGTFGSSTSASTTYDPATNEAGSNVTLIWTTTDPDGNGPCPVVTANVTVNVLSAAIADANGPYATCGVSPIAISATTNGNGTWTGGAGTFANASNASTTYTPTAAEVGTEITLTWETFDPDGSGPCSNAIDNTTLNISTPATATPGGPYTICSNGTAQIEVQTTPGGGSWSGGLGTFLNPLNSSTAYEPESSEGGGNVVLTWTSADPDNSGPCLPVLATVTVFILEEATAQILGPISTCANTEVTISSSSNGPGEWTYSPVSFGEIINSDSNQAVFVPSVDLFSDNEVTLTWTTFDPDGAGPCTAFSISEILQIESLPVINLNPTFNIDCGDDISALVTGGEGNYTYQWSPALGVISPTTITTPINASGVYTITATDQNSCANSAETEVLINALDQMAQSPDVETCLFEPVELSAVATLGEAPFSFSWSPTSFIAPGSGNSATVSFTYSQPITADTNFELIVNITDAFGCSDNETVNVLVHPLPIVNAGPDLAVCQYEPLFNISGYSPAETTGIGGQWTPSNSVNASSLNIGNNIFNYSFTDLNSCTNQDNLIVVVHEVPQSNFQYAATVCEGELVQFTNSSSCGTCGQLTYEWLIGNNLFESTATNINYTFQDTGFFDIQLITRSSFGCSDTIVQTIHVLALPETSFTLSTNSGCGPLPVTIENTSVGSELQYQWNLAPFGSNNYFQPGNVVMPTAPCDSIFYNVTLTALNLCGAVTVADSILVFALPQPSFSMSTDSICSENPLEIFNTTTCAWQTTYTWDFGDGTISDSQALLLEQTYFIEGNFASYPITLSAENNCGIVESTQIITVVPNEITAFFSANPLIGCEPLSVNFDQEMFGVTYFNWNFGDGQTSLIEDPSHIYENDGVFTATFLAGNFCGAQDTATQIIQVLPAPDFNFTSSEQFLCVGESTTFEPFGDAISSYQWNFGDGNSSSVDSPSHIYNTEGEFEVTVTGISAINGCPSTVSNIIEVITTPIAQINTNDAQGCPPFSVAFTNQTVNAVNYFWNLGDGNFFIGDSLIHVFNTPGDYSVQIIAVNDNSCTDTTTVAITVYPAPTAAFTFDTYDYDATYDVAFYNYSINAIGYEWNFGDGTTSFFTNPYYSYLKTGECAYVPELVAFNIFGCTDTARSIIPIPFLLDVFIPNSFSPNDDGLNDVFTVVTSDVDPYASHLMIIDRWGVTVHEAKGINPSWDGRIKGEPAPNDVYQYIYKGKLKCGLEEFQKIGHLTLIR